MPESSAFQPILSANTYSESYRFDAWGRKVLIRRESPSYEGRSTFMSYTQYAVACDANDHTIYYGDIADVAAYAYSGAECSIGTTGNYSFDPGTGSFFFVVVANDGLEEGTYGHDSSPAERPATAVCAYSQNLAGVICE